MQCVVSFSKTLYLLFSNGSTQEIVPTSLKNVDWDKKHHYKHMFEKTLVEIDFHFCGKYFACETLYKRKYKLTCFSRNFAVFAEKSKSTTYYYFQGKLYPDPDSKTHTLVSRLTALWAHVRKSRQQFEETPDRGNIMCMNPGG